MSTARPIAAERYCICRDCDTVYRLRDPGVREVAHCARCGAVLARHRRFGNDALAALVFAAVIVFIEGNIWPVVTLGLNGKQSSATLWGMILIMWHDQSQVVAVITAATLFFFPLATMLALGWLLWFARRGERAPGFRRLMVTLHYLGPWSMSEVFVLGALVAMVKAKAYFDVTPDAGIYAYGVLTILITIFAGMDVRHLWDSVPARPAWARAS
jgi:paraquat-inducible protein A